jgi:hypothetical protein
MNDIYNIASRLDILAQRTDELALHESGKLD